MPEIPYKEMVSINENYQNLRIFIKNLSQKVDQYKRQYYDYVQEEKNFYLEEANEEAHRLTGHPLDDESQREVLKRIKLDPSRADFQGGQYIANYLQYKRDHADTLSVLKEISEEMNDIGDTIYRKSFFSRISWMFMGNSEKYKILDRTEKMQTVNRDYLKHEKDLSELNRIEVTNQGDDLSILQASPDLATTDRTYAEYQELKEIEDQIDQITKDYLEFQRIYDERMFAARDKIDYIHDNGLTQMINATKLETLTEYQKDNRSLFDMAASKGIQYLGDISSPEAMMETFYFPEYASKRLMDIKTEFTKELRTYEKERVKERRSDQANEDILRMIYAIRMKRDLVSQLEEIQALVSGEDSPRHYMNQRVYSFWSYQNKIKSPDQTEAEFKAFLEDLKAYHLEDISYSDFLQVLDELSYDELLTDFKEHAADYYAIMEKYFDEFKASGHLNGKGLLSEEIIQEIQAFILNESKIKATLRSWQDFGSKYALVQKKVLVGDEMGLGKTLLAIAAMGHLAANRKKHFLVVCPKSIIINWQREILKHSYLRPYILHGVKEHRDRMVEAWKEAGGVGITTFATARRLDIFDMSLDLLTVDEAHYVKNRYSLRGESVKELTDNSKYAIYLTGTPIENKLKEFTTLLSNLQPDIGKEVMSPMVSSYPEKYKKIIAPVYIRRTKEDVALELPELQQVEEWTEFGKEEFEIYKEAVQMGKFMLMRRAAWLSYKEESEKLKRLAELVQDAKENGQKVIIFSFFREVMQLVADKLGYDAVQQINGDVPTKRRQEIIDEFKESDDKVALIAQVNTAAHGLNIQFANVIIFCEPQIKPSLESQAIARAYRMGQVNNVTVYRILTENSVDELMMEMLEIKQRIFDDYADKSEISESLKLNEAAIEKKVTDKILQLEKARLAV